MKNITRVFMNGLLVLIPIVITFYIIFWLVSGFETIFKNIIELFFRGIYFRGMGTLLGIGTIFLVGILMQNWGMQALYRYGEKLIAKFPVMGDVYSTLKSLLEYFTTPHKDAVEQVVVIEHEGVKLLGIVTRENFNDCPPGIGGEDIIAVFLPMSYQIGGYTVYLHRKHVTPIDMSKKDALQWILTAGVASVTNKKTVRDEPIKTQSVVLTK